MPVLYYPIAGWLFQASIVLPVRRVAIPNQCCINRSKPGMENGMIATEANRAVTPRQMTLAVRPRRWAVNN